MQHSMLKKFILAEARAGSQLDWASTLLSREIIDNMFIVWPGTIVRASHGHVHESLLTIPQIIKKYFDIEKSIMISRVFFRSRDFKNDSLKEILTNYKIGSLIVDIDVVPIEKHVSLSGALLPSTSWEDPRALRISINIPKEIFKDRNIEKQIHLIISTLIPKLKSALRHELEHAKQMCNKEISVEFLKNTYITPTNLTKEDLKSCESMQSFINSVKKYLNQQQELDAFVPQLVKAAKASNKNINAIVEEFAEKALSFDTAIAIHAILAHNKNLSNPCIQALLKAGNKIRREFLLKIFDKIDERFPTLKR